MYEIIDVSDCKSDVIEVEGVTEEKIDYLWVMAEELYGEFRKYKYAHICEKVTCELAKKL